MQLRLILNKGEDDQDVYYHTVDYSEVDYPGRLPKPPSTTGKRPPPTLGKQRNPLQTKDLGPEPKRKGTGNAPS